MSSHGIHSATPHDALIKALEHVEHMDNVLIIYEGKDGDKAGSFDSDITISEALYLTELFKHWLLSHAISEP